MPRDNGVFDDRTEGQAFAEGGKDYESGKTQLDQLLEKVPETMTGIFFGDVRSEQTKSYDAGYEKARQSDTFVNTPLGKSSKNASSFSSDEKPPRRPRQEKAGSTNPGHSSGYSSYTSSTDYSGSFANTVIAVVVIAVLYPILGVVGCIARSDNSRVPSPYDAQHDIWLYKPPLDSFSTEAVYIPLMLLAILLIWRVLSSLQVSVNKAFIIIILSMAILAFVGKPVVDSFDIRGALARFFSIDPRTAAGIPIDDRIAPKGSDFSPAKKEKRRKR